MHDLTTGDDSQFWEWHLHHSTMVFNFPCSFSPLSSCLGDCNHVMNYLVPYYRIERIQPQLLTEAISLQWAHPRHRMWILHVLRRHGIRRWLKFSLQVSSEMWEYNFPTESSSRSDLQYFVLDLVPGGDILIYFDIDHIHHNQGLDFFYPRNLLKLSLEIRRTSDALNAWYGEGNLAVVQIREGFVILVCILLDNRISGATPDRFCYHTYRGHYWIRIFYYPSTFLILKGRKAETGLQIAPEQYSCRIEAHFGYPYETIDPYGVRSKTIFVLF